MSTILPPIEGKTIRRPGRPGFEGQYMVPSPDHDEFWSFCYEQLRTLKYHSPILQYIPSNIDPYFGYYGYRVHPSTHEIQYSHIGIEIALALGQAVEPIRDGVLEYSGYGVVNGYYVLISHPDIVTEDGYVMHSMYCHLKKPLVAFNSYQKMLREISLGSYPIVPVADDQCIGQVGSTGTGNTDQPHLYVQVDFRKFGEEPVAIDPLLLFEEKEQINKTANITGETELAVFVEQHRRDLEAYGF